MNHTDLATLESTTSNTCPSDLYRLQQARDAYRDAHPVTVSIAPRQPSMSHARLDATLNQMEAVLSAQQKR